MYDVFHKEGLDEDLKFAWNDEDETVRKESTLMEEKTCSVSAVAGTATSGASIQGQVRSVVVTDLRDARTPTDHQSRHKVVMFQRRSLREGMRWFRTNFFGCDD